MKPLRRVFRAGEERGALTASPFGRDGCEAFLTWAGAQDHDAPGGVTRLLAEMYEERPDLQRAFPDLAGADRLRYLRWARDKGLAELGLPSRFAHSDGAVPAAVRARPEPAAEPQSVIEAPFGANVVGYFRSELGVGEAARQVVNALDAADVPLLPLHGRTIPLSRQGHPFTHLDYTDARYPINVICMNADALSEFAQQAGRQFFNGRYSIGLWFWEVSSVPSAGWNEQFALLDEVWAPTSHVARTLSEVSPVPVVRIRLPIEMPHTTPLARAPLGLTDDEFMFLFTFDYLSVFVRKNPLALVDAFRREFEPGSGAALVIKSINGEHDPANRGRLRDAVVDRTDIHLIEEYMTPGEKDALTATCDCYVSLHRAEGFGLTMAEAMYLGKPVIATGYSGNLDFMTAQNSYLVDWKPTPIGADAAPYEPHSEWAEPSVEHAAQLMRGVFDDREEALERGRRGAAEIRTTHSREAAGPVMLTRLQRARSKGIEEAREAFTVEVPTAATIERQVADAGNSATSIRAPREALRRAVLRIMKPFTGYQFSLDAQMLGRLNQIARDEVQTQATASVKSAWRSPRQNRIRAQLNDLLALRQPIADRLDELSEQLAAARRGPRRSRTWRARRSCAPPIPSPVSFSDTTRRAPPVTRTTIARSRTCSGGPRTSSASASAATCPSSASVRRCSTSAAGAVSYSICSASQGSTASASTPTPGWSPGAARRGTRRYSRRTGSRTFERSRIAASASSSARR